MRQLAESGRHPRPRVRSRWRHRRCPQCSHRQLRQDVSDTPNRRQSFFSNRYLSVGSADLRSERESLVSVLRICSHAALEVSTGARCWSRMRVRLLTDIPRVPSQRTAGLFHSHPAKHQRVLGTATWLLLQLDDLASPSLVVEDLDHLFRKLVDRRAIAAPN